MAANDFETVILAGDKVVHYKTDCQKTKTTLVYM